MARKASGKAAKAAEPEKSTQHGTLIRVADDVAADAKLVASFLDVSIAKYVSDTLRPIVRKELEQQMRRRLAEVESSTEIDEPKPGKGDA